MLMPLHISAISYLYSTRRHNNAKYLDNLLFFKLYLSLRAARIGLVGRMRVAGLADIAQVYIATCLRYLLYHVTQCHDVTQSRVSQKTAMAVLLYYKYKVCHDKNNVKKNTGLRLRTYFFFLLCHAPSFVATMSALWWPAVFTPSTMTLTPQYIDVTTRRRHNSSTSQLVDVTTRRRHNSSTAQLVDVTTRRRHNSSTSQLVDGTTRRRHNTSTSQYVDVTTRRRHNSSTSQLVDVTTRRRHNSSTAQLVDVTTRRRHNSSTSQLVDVTTRRRHNSSTITCCKDGSRHRKSNIRYASVTVSNLQVTQYRDQWSRLLNDAIHALETTLL